MPSITTADNTEIKVKDWGIRQSVMLMNGWPLFSPSWGNGAIAWVQAATHKQRLSKDGLDFLKA
jgi:hypothetical protein